MSLWKFKDKECIEDLILKTVGAEFLLPSSSPNVLECFHNGDRMTVDMETGELDWEPVNPGELSSSKLSLRLHQWYAKGIIYLVE